MQAATKGTLSTIALKIPKEKETKYILPNVFCKKSANIFNCPVHSKVDTANKIPAKKRILDISTFFNMNEMEYLDLKSLSFLRNKRSVTSHNKPKEKIMPIYGGISNRAFNTGTKIKPNMPKKNTTY